MRILYFVLIMLMIVSVAPAQAEEWVEIDTFEESTVLSKDAPSVTFNDRTYKFEIGATRSYEKGTSLSFLVWSSEFRPFVLVREAWSKKGKAGNGDIIVSGTNSIRDNNGVEIYISEISFEPSETNNYRLIVTSVEDIASDIAHTGKIDISWTMYEWKEPEVVKPDRPADAYVNGCTIGGADGLLSEWDAAEYGAVWVADIDNKRSYDTRIFTLRTKLSFGKAQELADRIKPVQPDMTFVDMMSRDEACDFILKTCGSADGFAKNCVPLGYAAIPEQRFSR